METRFSSAVRPECLCKLDPKFKLPFHCYDKEEVGQRTQVSSIVDRFHTRNSYAARIADVRRFTLSSIGSDNLIRSDRVKLAGVLQKIGLSMTVWTDSERAKTAESFNGALVWKVMIVMWINDRFNVNVTAMFRCQGWKTLTKNYARFSVIRYK